MCSENIQGMNLRVEIVGKSEVLLFPQLCENIHKYKTVTMPEAKCIFYLIF